MSDSPLPPKIMRPNACSRCERQFASSLTPLHDIRTCKTCHKQIIYDAEKDGGGDSGVPIKTYQLNLFRRKDWLGPRQEIEDEVLKVLEPTDQELALKAEEEKEEEKKKKKAALEKREADQKLKSLLKVVSVGESPIIGKPWLQAWHSPFGLENHIILENAMRGDSLQWTYVVTADVAAYRFMRIASLDRIPFQLGVLQRLTPVANITHSPHKPAAVAPKPENTAAALFSHFSPSERAQIQAEAETIKTQIRQVLKM